MKLENPQCLKIIWKVLFYNLDHCSQTNICIDLNFRYIRIKFKRDIYCDFESSENGYLPRSLEWFMMGNYAKNMPKTCEDSGMNFSQKTLISWRYQSRI